MQAILYLLSFKLINFLRFKLQLQMKGRNSDEKKSEDSDSDSFDIEEWRMEKRVQTQEIRHEQFAKKRTNSDMDGKVTVKSKQDNVMNLMYEKILRESGKFEDQIEDPANQNKDLYEYNPQIICGKLTNIRNCSQKEKDQFSLSDENECQAMDLTEDVIVVLVGKIGYSPIEGINANLYIPKEFYEYMQQKQSKNKPPERLVKTSDKRYVVWIKRQYNKEGSTNIMCYPYLVLDPYNLLYPSYLCSWIDCKRLISLNNYIQGQKEVNEAVVFGSTCHRLLQWLAENLVTVSQYTTKKKSVLEKLYQSMLYDMFVIDRTYDQFIQVCSGRLDNLVRFYQRHILRGEEIEIEKYKKTYLKIEKIVSSEYMFRSNFFGLKGKVDLLLSGQYIDKKTGKHQQVYIPMELKTGKKVSDTHRRQTDIYNILVREKYKANVIGLLYYSDSDIKYIRNQDPLLAFEIIILHRNQIAQNLVKLYQNGNINLPGFPFSFSQCNFCQQSGICELSFKQIEQCGNQVKNIEEIPSKYHKEIVTTEKKYKRHEIEYISKWFKLIHLEEMQFKKLNTDYWKMGISSFVLPSNQLRNLKDTTTKIRLQLKHRCKSQEELFVFEEYYKISMKIRLVVNQMSMIQGCKIVTTSTQIESKYFILLVEMNNFEIQFSPSKLHYFIQHQIDLDVDIETFDNSFFGVMRNTVLNLVETQNPLKSILINDEPLKIGIQIDEDEDYTVLKQQYVIHQEEYEGFNEDQKKAYRKSVLQKIFCLVEGMPGTGKTELIIRLIEKFSKMKKTVLVTTFTNRALDNILERLIDSGRVPKDKVIRQGAQYACSKTIKEYTSHGATFYNLSDYKKFFAKKQIWFVTLNSLYIHHLPKSFDVVILDEASQCLEPTCIEGLLRSKKFILIGDYKQLQPLIKSKQAHRKGMCISLFQRLCKSYPQNCISLKKQYRMNEKIMMLSNKLVYNGELQLATEKIKLKTIKLPIEWKERVPDSFADVISPENSIVFVNYDPIIDSITKRYKQKQSIIRKIIQAELSSYVYRIYIDLLVPFNSISVIAAMNTSVNKIVELLKQSKTIQDNHGAILTIDKSQGIDKDIIILLIQRGNEDLIQNPRRLNVALTRAKSKLIIIGSDEHLSKMKVWDGTLGKMLKEYQVQLSKPMIEDMINLLECF